MRKAVLLRFGMILVLALAVSGMVSGFLMGNKLLEDNQKNLLHVVYMVEYTLHGKQDLQKECMQIKAQLKDENVRITVVAADGAVLADTEAATFDGMENHLEREEIRTAFRGETGYATRYSDTLQENMLYVAALSASEGYVVRVASSYDGLREYIPSMLPILLLGAAAAALIAFVAAVHFAGTIAGPLSEISAKLQDKHTVPWDFHFPVYRYEELNIIGEAITGLAGEVKEQISRLEFERKVRQEFFGNASHELKTPVTAIRGYAELLDNGFVADEEKQSEFIRRILKTAEHMSRLIEDILLISRLETKDVEVTYSMVRLDLLIREIFDVVEPIAKKHQVTLCSQCEEVTLEASVRQMRELLMNLVVNGVTYNQPGGHVWVEIRADKEKVIIRVRDDGVGIGREDQARIFERFYRVDKGRSRKLGGTGLGLSIVKHIVEYNEGDLRLKSSPGEGSEFMICIPFSRNIL